jgi:rhodanese-related sulfurtransferase
VPSIEELTARARTSLRRAAPDDAARAMGDGATLVDIRDVLQVQADGLVPGAVLVARNVLEWRCDPASPWRAPGLTDGRRLIVLCNEGFQSSLVAATLQSLGHDDATDVVGGFVAWRAAGLPVLPAADGWTATRLA